MKSFTCWKQCRPMTMKGYDMVNIIQISIILMYPVIGKELEIPMKLCFYFSNGNNLSKVQNLTYYVVNTKRRVAFTSITISRYVLLNVVDIWLIKSSIAVGRNIVSELLVSGLLIIKSTNNPDLPFLSTWQNCMCLKWYLPRSLPPVYTIFMGLIIMLFPKILI